MFSHVMEQLSVLVPLGKEVVWPKRGMRVVGDMLVLKKSESVSKSKLKASLGRRGKE